MSSGIYPFHFILFNGSFLAAIKVVELLNTPSFHFSILFCVNMLPWVWDAFSNSRSCSSLFHCAHHQQIMPLCLQHLGIHRHPIAITCFHYFQQKQTQKALATTLGVVHNPQNSRCHVWHRHCRLSIDTPCQVHDLSCKEHRTCKERENIICFVFILKA